MATTMESLFARDWISHQDGYQWNEQPIYVGMHDPRAVVDYSTIDEPSAKSTPPFNNKEKDNG